MASLYDNHMSRAGAPAVNVPCGVCCEMIKRWEPGQEETECPWAGPYGNATAQPCGHTLEDIWHEWCRALERRIA